jgi:hypothetical protein
MAGLNEQAKLNQVEIVESQGYGSQICWLNSRPHVAKVLSHTKVKNVQLYGDVTQMDQAPRIMMG